MFDFQPHLIGELVSLRPTLPTDWDALHAVGSDPEIWEQHPRANRGTELQFRIYFDEGLSSGASLIALNRTDGAMVGWSRYLTEYAEPGEIEIGGTFLGRAYWGGAYNRDMKALMLNHAFRFVPRVIFRIGEHNLRSRRATEKIGAKLTDRVQTVIIDGKPSLHLFYELSRHQIR
jgi:RimJ/RimL family protein N-acetyltransferase